MTEEHDPIRLLDDEAEPGSLRELLRAGRDDLPQADAVERLERRIFAAIAVGGGGGGSGGPGGSGGGAPAVAPAAAPAAGAATSTAGVLATVGLGLGALGLVGLGLAIHAGPTWLAPASAPPVAATVVDGGSDASLAVADGGTAAPAPADPVPGGPEPSDRSPSGRGPTSPGTREREPETRPESVSETAETPTVETAETGVAPVVEETEAILLLSAHRALRASRPAEALELAERAAAAYPEGDGAQEREMIAIEALEALGREASARERAARFRERWPGSSHVRRLDVLVPP